MGLRETDSERQPRNDRLIKEREHDPYMTRLKLSDATLCPQCGVEFRGGRWQWTHDMVRKDVREQLCPACRRIRDRVPAGVLTLSGEFFEANRTEIMRLVRNKEAAEKSRRPMKRLMGVRNDEFGCVLTFTDSSMPRSFGAAVQHAYQGELEGQYTEEAGIVRVTWKREESGR